MFIFKTKKEEKRPVGLPAVSIFLLHLTCKNEEKKWDRKKETGYYNNRQEVVFSISK